ncbi:MAG: xanthine dehydrogenase family protein molybdopterin-binding subunit [Planctomycetaceae bacterium]
MAELSVAWGPREENKLLGTDVPRIEGVEKATGHAKYSADINTKGTAYCKLLTCKQGHARIAKLDVDDAKKIKGVLAIHVLQDVGDELTYDGQIIAAVAAERPDYADDGIRAIKLQLEPLAHFVDEDDLETAKALDAEHTEVVEEETVVKEESAKLGHMVRVKPLADDTNGDVAAAVEKAKAVHKGYYGVHTISHMCLEPHGSHCEWTGDDSLLVHLSTQNVSGTAGQFAEPLGLDAANVEIVCNYIGGGFGSKFAAGEWGLACAELAKEIKRPVRLMLDRPTELKSAGIRPSGFVEVTIAADEDGRITAWDSHHWGSSGLNGGTVSPGVMPYVFTFENLNRRATGLVTNTGPQQAWRAPNHPQACALSQTAIADLADKLKMDSYDVFMKNLEQTKRPEVYAEEMKIAAKLIDWKAKWHPSGEGNGPVKQGLGMALHTWGGAAHAATCLLRVHPDGTVESIAGSQDIGTGTRTAIAIVVAETLGLPLSWVKVTIGSSKYPRSGPSGGSTTIGGVSGPNRRAAIQALGKIFDLVAAKYKTDAAMLTARSGKILSDGKEICTWKDACGLIGAMPMEVMGEGPKDDGLTDAQVGGVQMADVSVDTETGIVRINKFVAVQDCGLIVDLMTAKSQVYGALIMGIAYALSEERIMDNKTGRYINADLETYKLPRIGDIGELVVEMYQPDSEYQRGVIGLGEPPVIAPGAAISNAVANALGVRVPVLPLTPQRVLEALKGGAA